MDKVDEANHQHLQARLKSLVNLRTGHFTQVTCPEVKIFAPEVAKCALKKKLLRCSSFLARWRCPQTTRRHDFSGETLSTPSCFDKIYLEQVRFHHLQVFVWQLSTYQSKKRRKNLQPHFLLSISLIYSLFKTINISLFRLFFCLRLKLATFNSKLKRWIVKRNMKLCIRWAA